MPFDELEQDRDANETLGRELSAMNLPAAGDPRRRPVEAVYQARKCYGRGGPDAPGCDSGYAAKRRDRERRRDGPLSAFERLGRRWTAKRGHAGMREARGSPIKSRPVSAS